MVADRSLRLLAGLLLVAGAATRFGSAKSLARIGSESMLARSERLLSEQCGAGVIAVTGSRHAAIAGSVQGRVARNAAWHQGMSGSIRIGIAALPARSMAVLLMPGDLPRVSREDLQHLVQQWLSATTHCIAARYAGRLGAPAIVPRRWWPSLTSLRGDIGARRMIAAAPGVVAVDMASAATDIDTVAEWRDLEGKDTKGG